MICPLCLTPMKITNRISSDKIAMDIRKYECSKGHIFVGQEELLDDEQLESLRTKDSKSF